MAKNLEGKAAFITGVARGQGRAHALRLAKEGVGVDICADIDGVEYGLSTPDDLAETVKLVEKTGRRIVTGIADVRDQSAMAEVYQQGLSEFGRLDFVIAGVMPVCGSRSNEFASW